jgi:copper resistance protein B
MDPNMPGMKMPGKAQVPAKLKATTAKPAPATASASGQPPPAVPPATPPAAAGQDMKGMAMPVAQEPPIPDTPAPPPATDHLADRYYDPAAMEAARHMMRREMGGAVFSKFMANLAEYQAGPHGGGYRWDAQAWLGGDTNRLVLRSEGDGGVEEGLEAGEVQALYSRAVGRYFDLQAGVRQDFAPRGRTYLALGTQGLFPYWFDVEGSLFLSTKGELLARAEGSYDFRLTQRLVLQPRAELNFAAQDIPETRTGSGLSNAELGLRLRYETRREFAPYIGLSWDRRLGKTADYVRADGQNPEAATFVVGLRTWF